MIGFPIVHEFWKQNPVPLAAHFSACATFPRVYSNNIFAIFVLFPIFFQKIETLGISSPEENSTDIPASMGYPTMNNTILNNTKSINPKCCLQHSKKKQLI